MAVDEGFVISQAKKLAIKYGAVQIESIAPNDLQDSIVFTMVGGVTHTVPLSSLAFLLETDLSDSIDSNSSTVPASSSAVLNLNNKLNTSVDTLITKFNDYILKTNISDSITSNDSSYVASSKAIYTLDQNKIDKSEITTTILNNPTKPASASVVYAVDQKLGNYVLKENISNDIASNSTTNVASSYALNGLKEDVAIKYIPVANITDDYIGTSESLVLSQRGAEMLKDLIVAGISGMSYSGRIDSVTFNALDNWNHGEVYKAKEEIVFGIATIPINALIIFKTTTNEGQPLTLDDFDFFASEFDFSHTTSEIDKATDMALDSNFTQLGFIDIQNCELTFDEVTRTVYVQPKALALTTSCYINSNRVNITSQLSIVFPDTTNKHIITLSEAGNLSYTLEYDYSDPTVMPICMIRWDSVGKKINALFDYRVHNLKMDIPTRGYVYSNGVQWQSGFAISDFGLGDNAQDSVCKFSLTGGKIRQAEKLITYVNNATPTNSYEAIFAPSFNSKSYYMEGKIFKGDPISDVCLKMGTAYPYYNKNINGNFSLAETSSGKYIAVFIGASTDMRPNQSTIAIMGQGEYDSIDECKTRETLGLIDFGDLEFKQIRFLYRLIFHVSDEYTNTYKSKLIEYLDVREFSLLRTFSSDTRISGGGTSLTKVEISSSEYLTAVRNTSYYLKDGSAGSNITLPSSGLTAQDKIEFIDTDGVLTTNTVTIDGNINENANTLILNTPYSTASFEWTGTTWIVRTSIFVDTIKAIASSTSSASVNIPVGIAPTIPNIGDVFNDGELKFRENNITLNMLGDVGDVKLTARVTAPNGWLICDGSDISRATYAKLFEAIGTTYGSSNISTFKLPDMRGRTPIGSGQSTFKTTFPYTSVNVSTDIITVDENDSLFTGTPVVLSVEGGTVPTGLVVGTTYYIIQLSSTTIKLASTLVNALAGTAVNMTVLGTGTCTLTVNYSNRTIGRVGGEEKHLATKAELQHVHTANSSNTGDFNNQLARVTSVTGMTGMSGVAGNNMMPYIVLNYIIKY